MAEKECRIMKTWKAYFVVNGDGYSAYPQVDFEVDDELYAQIENAVKNMVPLCQCEFYKKLVQLAYDAHLDPHEYLPMLDDEPDPDDYDEEDEYQEALEEYKEYLDELMDSVSFEGCTIEDPGDRLRFEQKIIGQNFPEWAGLELVQEEFNDDMAVTRYTVWLKVDEDGFVTGIMDIRAEGMEREGLQFSSYHDVYPDYDQIYDSLMREHMAQNAERKDKEE